ncbi:MAG: hypothetical protein DMF56_19295 [Acidobacteria bacterium]|nr:MAG: hypothetical protein DMF56_19295 [Acidobacteriota bacterium]
MNDSSGWKDAYRDVIAEGRKRLDPPTVDEVEALFENKLPEAEAERVRKLLAYYPEMARAMIEPFPADTAGVLTAEELAADLAAIRRKTGITPAATQTPAATPAAAPTPVPKPLPFPKRLPRPAFAVAAGLIVVLAIGAIVAGLFKSGPAASIAVTRKVYPTDIGARGGASAPPPILLEQDRDYRLELVFTPDREYREYRLVFLDLGSAPARSLWSRDHEHPEQPGVYAVPLSTKKLPPGLYELVLYGLDDGEAEHLATFAIRVSS